MEKIIAGSLLNPLYGGCAGGLGGDEGGLCRVVRGVVRGAGWIRRHSEFENHSRSKVWSTLRHPKSQTLITFSHPFSCLQNQAIFKVSDAKGARTNVI